jgi:hypothetical protein
LENKVIKSLLYVPLFVSAVPVALALQAGRGAAAAENACSPVTSYDDFQEVAPPTRTRGSLGSMGYLLDGHLIVYNRKPDEARSVHLPSQPTDIALAPAGDFCVAAGHSNPDPMVVKFGKNGKYVTSWPMKWPNGSAATLHTINNTYN